MIATAIKTDFFFFKFSLGFTSPEHVECLLAAEKE